MTTTRHTLQLVAGPFHVDLIESDSTVQTRMTGAVALGFERKKVIRFLWPLVHQYHADGRVISISARGSSEVGHVQYMHGLGVRFWKTDAEAAHE